jgi:hypothetical protein
MKNNFKLLLIISIMLYTKVAHAQVQVGIETLTPDDSAILDLNGTNKGLLLPRLSSAQRNAPTGILSPVGGIVIYDITLNAIVISLENGKWKNATTGAEVLTTPGITSSVGKIGIGTTFVDNNTILDVVSTTQGILLPTGTVDPVGVTGMIYYNTTDNTVKYYGTSSWITVLTN